MFVTSIYIRRRPSPHAFCTDNGTDCMACPLPRTNAVHEVNQHSLLESA